jgi:hypothetical protein
MAERLLAMWAAGGERAEDLDRFRQDQALALLLGHELPAAQTARDFLAQFQLSGLAKANAELVLDLQCRRPIKTATLHIDAPLIHCDKRPAKRAGACPRAGGGRQSRLPAGAGVVGRTRRHRCRRIPRRQ